MHEEKEKLSDKLVELTAEFEHFKSVKREQISELKERVQKLSKLEVEIEQYQDYKYLAAELERTTGLCHSKDELINKLETQLSSL